MNEEDQLEEFEQVIAPDVDLSEFNQAFTAQAQPGVEDAPQVQQDQAKPKMMTLPPAKPGQKTLDPTVYNYLFKLAADRQGDQAQLARQASRDVRAQSTLAAAGGIARGLAQTGTLFGKAPDASPYVDTLKGLSAAQEDFAKRQHANKLVGMSQANTIDKRVLDYLMPQTAKGGAGAAKGAWKQVIGQDGKPIWQYLTPGQTYDAPTSTAQSKWLKMPFPPDHPLAGKPAFGRMKPDGTWEYAERDPGTRQITTVGPDGKPRIQIVPDVPTTSGPPGARRAAPATPAPVTPPGVTQSPGAATPPTKLPPTTKVPQPSGSDTWPELKEGKDKEPQPAETPPAEEGYPAYEKPEKLVPVKTVDSKTGQESTRYVTPKVAAELGQIKGAPPTTIVANATAKRAAAATIIEYLKEMDDLFQKNGRKLFNPLDTSYEKARYNHIIGAYAMNRQRYEDPGSTVTLPEQELVKRYSGPFTLWEKANATPDKVKKEIEGMIREIKRGTDLYQREAGLDAVYGEKEYSGKEKPKSGPGALPELTPEEDKPKAAERPGARRKARGFWWESDGKGWRKAEPAN